MSDDILTHQFFTPLIGEPFALALNAGGGSFALTLEAVTPLSPPRQQDTSGKAIPITDRSVRQEPFSLRFKGPLSLMLPQATYRMTAETVSAPMDIFIVPVGRESDGFIYEAVFG